MKNYIGILMITLTIMACSDPKCEFKKEYDLTNFTSNTELFIIENSEYVHYDNKQLEGRYDFANIFNFESFDTVFNINLTFSKIKFETDSTGVLTEVKSNKKHVFIYNISENIITASINQFDREFIYELKDNCKVENCTYVVSTLKNDTISLNYLYSIDCRDRNYLEAAQMFLNNYNDVVPDTIGIFEIIHVEK